MSEGLITFWRSFIPLWRSIQPINTLTIAGQQYCFDRIHSKLGICLWFPPGAALCAYPCSDSSGSAHCEQRNHSQALRGAKRSTPAVSWAAAVGQQCCHRGGCLGSTQEDRRGNREKCCKSSLSSKKHAIRQRRWRFLHSHPPCSPRAAVELKQPCKKQMTAQVCSSRAACAGALGSPRLQELQWEPWLPSLPQHLLLQQDIPGVSKSVSNLALQPQGSGDRMGFPGCLSKQLLHHFLQECVALTGSCEGTVGLSWYQVTLPDGDWDEIIY